MDKKLSASAIKDFTKDEAKRKKLVKVETYYEMDSIKKLWRYIFHAIIEFISLDAIFDQVRTHHFVLLNHFWQGIKISFPFYLFSSLSKNIEGFTKKTSENIALHEGFLLLFCEFFKPQTRGKDISHFGGGSEDSCSSDFSSNSEDIQSSK